MTTVRKATAADVDRLVEVLCRAFDDDPGVNWVVRAGARRAIGMDTLFRSGLEMALPHDEVYTTGDLSGAAAWFPPGRWQLGPLQQLRYLPSFVRMAGRRLMRSLRAVREMERRHVTMPHYYLLSLGVDPERQGHGVGKAILEPMLRHCDATGTPAYLETTNGANLGFYRARGFELRDEVAMPGGGPPMWTMLRAPRARG